MTLSRSPSSRWTAEHGYGHGGKRGLRLRKIAYVKKSEADDTALLMDLRHGVPFSVFACRWGENYRDGEVFPVHWHVGRAKELRGDE